MLYSLMLCYCRFVYMQKERDNHHHIFVVLNLSARPALLTSSQSATEASETLLYEKWSSTSFFDITLSVTKRLESEGGALWRKHSCSGHLYRSCNLHRSRTTLRAGRENYFLLHSAERKQTSHSWNDPPEIWGVAEHYLDEDMTFQCKWISGTRVVMVYLFILSVISLIYL